MAAARSTVKLTANFERNLASIDAFLLEAGTPQAFDALLDDLTDTVVPNLERFPVMGRIFLERPVRSVEVANGTERLVEQMKAIAGDLALRDYLMEHYVLLYAHTAGAVYLLSIRHHRQLSFDVPALWSNG